MTHHVSTAELKRMSVQELLKEVYVRRAECAKMRIGLKVQSEKNHALYSVKRKEIARMLTIIGQLQAGTAASVSAKPVTASPSQTTKTSVKDVSSTPKKPSKNKKK